MPHGSNRIELAGVLLLTLAVAAGLPRVSPAQVPVASTNTPGPFTPITNVAQLSRALALEDRVYCRLELEVAVCAASGRDIGVLVVQDATGVELLELGRRTEQIAAGDRIRIEGDRVLLRRREFGTQVSAAPLVPNDGLHMVRTVAGEILLKAGRVPLELDWFNGLRNFALDITCQPPNGEPQPLADSSLWHAPTEPGHTNLLPGLAAECYEGYWEQVPDFELLRPAKTGSITNFDLGFRTQDEMVGLRFTGFFNAPSDGRYIFRVTSDDGSLLFIGSSEVSITRLGRVARPLPETGVIGQPMDQFEERRWLSLAGRVNFVSAQGAGLRLELRAGADTASVTVADANGLEPAALLNKYVRAAGVGRAALSGSRRLVLDRLYVAGAADLKPVEAELESAGPSLRLTDIGQVQTIPIQDANKALPVRIRGVVTAANWSDRWLSLQDDTRGIFVDLHGTSNAIPAAAEFWEVTGHTAKGNFAPIVVAEQLKRYGRGRMPKPARPSWNELANGSMDVQWVEFQGLVSGVHSNVLDLLLPEGTLQVAMENHFEPELQQYRDAVIRVRGTLFAIWNAITREVQFGSLSMRNASVSVDTPAPVDPFQAPVKTARELLQFDAQATAFRPVKVRVQVLYAAGPTIFAIDQGMGVRVLTADLLSLQPGDTIEAVGYPEISGPSPLLRQALVRRIGSSPLPKPTVLATPDLARKGLDSSLVRLEARLVAMHFEQNSLVLELQSSNHLFNARVKPGPQSQVSLRLGSRLQLSGVFAEMGRRQRFGSPVESFELLLNSPADIRVLSQPSWWTLERLATLVGFLLIVLVLAAGWISQLRRLVEQRTAQLQREIRERERAEQHRALEAERSRIARDLHDDLGASLTEIGALANTGQHANGAPGGSLELFDAIAGKARGSIDALDVIVWAVDPEDNSLQSLADYLSGFAGEYLSHSNIVCRFKIPVTFPAIMLEGRLRHDLFLAVKETLNNVVRHAQATEVEFGIVVTEGAFEIVIADNGRGFDATVAREGNGLKNLRGRLAKLGGTCVIGSHTGAGTTVTIRLPLPVPHAPHTVIH